MGRTRIFLLMLIVGILVLFSFGYWTGLSNGLRIAVKMVAPILAVVEALASRRFDHLKKWYPLILGLISGTMVD